MLRTPTTTGEDMLDERRERERMVHITARVPATLADAFEALAVAEDRSVSAELRRAMRAHVEALESHPSGTARVSRAG